ncbi:MAG: hypothetical protein JSR93_07255 [Verrucomicrobia bacterium]|nr:hypothetical protein [Verrucomicrobiota bacterium]
MVTRAISGIVEPITDRYNEIAPLLSEASREIAHFAEPVTDAYDNFFIEPFRQGYYNLRDAVVGTKAQSIAQAIINPNAPQRDLSLIERVSSAAVGILLIIPIVNSVVMAILKGIKSDLLYLTKASEIAARAIVPVNDPPIAPLNTDPVSAEEMVARKRGALARFAALETMASPGQDPIPQLNTQFRLHSQALRFNLDEVLQRYQTTHTPAKLFDFMDWADIPNDYQRDRFRRAVNQFENLHGGREEYETIRGLLSNMAEYFSQQQARVGAGTDEETALKEQFTRVFDSLIDANNNCIHQTQAQVQSLLLDVIAEGDAASNGGSAQTKIIYQTGLALCKYRQNLLREILIRQNPDNRNMADFERAFTRRLAGILGLQGTIFEAGAVYNFESNHLEGRVDRALQAFREEYKPFEHLVKELRTYHGAYQRLRNEILIWATGYYGFTDEPGANLPDGTAAPDMEARLSEDPDNILSDGGNFNCQGVVLLLETLGLLRPAETQTTA